MGEQTSDSNENKNEKYTQSKREKSETREERKISMMKVNIHTVYSNYV